MDTDDIVYRLFPDRDTSYAPGDQVNVVEGSDGRPDLVEHPSGDYEGVECTRIEYAGLLMLRAGLRPRH
jgi:hypothetical protein